MFSRAELPEDAKEIRGKTLENRTVTFDGQVQPDGRAKATRVVIPYSEGDKCPGKIKSYSHKHGYGFVQCSSLTEDIRFNRNSFQPPLAAAEGTDLRGALVLLEMTHTDDGKNRAEKIQFQTKKVAERFGGNGAAAPQGQANGFGNAFG